MKILDYLDFVIDYCYDGPNRNTEILTNDDLDDIRMILNQAEDEGCQSGIHESYIRVTIAPDMDIERFKKIAEEIGERLFHTGLFDKMTFNEKTGSEKKVYYTIKDK